MTTLRAIFRLARATLHLLGGSLTVALIFPFISPSRRLWLKQRWSRQLLDALGVTLKVGPDAMKWPEGAAATSAVQGMIVANHISFLDIFAINALAPAAFVSKDDVRAWPLIGWLCAYTDTIFIERGSRRAAHATRENLVAHLKEGRLVSVFPEGTTSDGHDVLPFHGALFQSAIDAGATITPVVLRYSDRSGNHSAAADYVGDTSLLECFWSIACANELVVQLEVLQPISSEGADRRHLAAHAHHMVAHGLRRFNPSPKVSPAADRASGTPAGLPAVQP